jgi:hypothetical protein
VNLPHCGKRAVGKPNSHNQNGTGSGGWVIITAPLGGIIRRVPDPASRFSRKVRQICNNG